MRLVFVAHRHLRQLVAIAEERWTDVDAAGVADAEAAPTDQLTTMTTIAERWGAVTAALDDAVVTEFTPAVDDVAQRLTTRTSGPPIADELASNIRSTGATLGESAGLMRRRAERVSNKASGKSGLEEAAGQLAAAYERAADAMDRAARVLAIGGF